MRLARPGLVVTCKVLSATCAREICVSGAVRLALIIAPDGVDAKEASFWRTGKTSQVIRVGAIVNLAA